MPISDEELDRKKQSIEDWPQHIKIRVGEAEDQLKLIAQAREANKLRKLLREILSSGTETMTKNYRVVQIDHQTWSEAEEALDVAQ